MRSLVSTISNMMVESTNDPEIATGSMTIRLSQIDKEILRHHQEQMKLEPTPENVGAIASHAGWIAELHSAKTKHEVRERNKKTDNSYIQSMMNRKK